VQTRKVMQNTLNINSDIFAPEYRNLIYSARANWHQLP
jgi:hypothetical protein